MPSVRSPNSPIPTPNDVEMDCQFKTIEVFSKERLEFPSQDITRSFPEGVELYQHADQVGILL